MINKGYPVSAWSKNYLWKYRIISLNIFPRLRTYADTAIDGGIYKLSNRRVEMLINIILLPLFISRGDV